jgi:phosphoribosyl 1,2-cyclic phosphate phosphodiesterase
MEVYANMLTQEGLRREFYYAFSDNKYPGIPTMNLNTISDEPFIVGDIPVIPIQVYHLKMPVLGFRFGKFTYLTDANRIEDEEKAKIKGSQILVVNALRKKEHISHFTLQEAVDLVNELEIPTAYFTHISHQLGLHEEIEEELPSNMHLAYDGLQLTIPGK